MRLKQLRGINILQLFNFFMKILAYVAIIIVLILGGWCLYHHLVLLVSRINTRESGFYRDHFIFFCAAPSAVYIATLIAAIVCFLENNIEETTILGYKTGKVFGIILVWLIVFLTVIFGFKFLW